MAFSWKFKGSLFRESSKLENNLFQYSTELYSEIINWNLPETYTKFQCNMHRICLGNMWNLSGKFFVNSGGKSLEVQQKIYGISVEFSQEFQFFHRNSTEIPKIFH